MLQRKIRFKIVQVPHLLCVGVVAKFYLEESCHNANPLPNNKNILSTCY